MHLYTSSWEKASGPAWLARHNIDNTTYQRDFNELPDQGYRAVSIAAVSSAEGTRFASVWEKTGGPAWRGRHGLSSGEYRAAKAELEGQGFKPRCLSGYTENGQARFIGLWEQVASDRTALIDLTSAQYQAELDTRTAQGAHPIWVTVYATPAGARYGAIFETSDSPDGMTLHNVGVAAFTAFAEERAKSGFRLVCAQGCAVSGGDVYTGVWEMAAGQTWQQRYGLSADDHQTVFNLLARAGYRLRFIGAGDAQKRITLGRHAVAAYHAQFGNTAADMKAKLNARSYAVTLTDVAADAVKAINTHADLRHPGDRVFIYLGVHGGTGRWSLDDDDPAKCGNHALQTSNGTFYLRDVLPAFERLAGKGVDLTVVDGSCNGGETIMAAMGRNYAAISTVGMMAPGLTGIPNPAADMIPADPDSFGYWWNPSRTMASRLNGQYKGQRPDRIAQKVFRNDDCEAGRFALFWRSAYSYYSIGQSWEMSGYKCHIFRYVYKEAFGQLAQAEKDKYTVSVDAYVTALHGLIATVQNRMGQLKSYLANTALNNAAAAIYAPHDKTAWRLMNFDPELWTPETDPSAQFAEVLKRMEYWRKYWVYPNQYPGVQGFHRMVSDISTVISDLEALMEEMFDLFRRIERAARFLPAATIPLTDTAPVLKQPETLEEVRRYNEVQTKSYERHMRIVKAVKLRGMPLARVTSRPLFAKFEAEFVSMELAGHIAEWVKPYRLDKSLENLVIDLHKVYERQISLLIKGSNLLSVVEDAWFAAQRNGRTYACDAGQF